LKPFGEERRNRKRPLESGKVGKGIQSGVKCLFVLSWKRTWEKRVCMKEKNYQGRGGPYTFMAQSKKAMRFHNWFLIGSEYGRRRLRTSGVRGVDCSEKGGVTVHAPRAE